MGSPTSRVVGVSRMVEPISKSIKAMPHRPVYSIHRYFARRPYNVFSNLIRHYSKENDLIMDPFMGGGVTIVESLLLSRNAIGFDLNPMSEFITREQIKSCDLDLLEKEVEKLENSLKDILMETFGTECSTCEERVVAEWFEYSAITSCDKFKHTFSVNEATKIRPATWSCPSCEKNKIMQEVKIVCEVDTQFELINKHYSCDKCSEDVVCEPNPEDLTNYKQSQKRLESSIKNGLWIPDVMIPECNMEQESALHKKGIVNFNQLFTHRHLHILGEMKKLILNLEPSFRETLLFIFSSTLRYCNRMTTRNPSWRGNKPLEWNKPGYWLPQSHLEANPMTQFKRRFQAYLRGKRNLSKVSGDAVFEEIQLENIIDAKEFTGYHLQNRSSTSIPLPDSSVDVIITDPPYGSYIHYADLTNFWAVWLPELGMGKTIQTDEEAVVARKKFTGAKNFDDYRELLERCFKECYRVLKPDSYMVMTFNNREPASWAALILAAKNAGFQLADKGLIYQPGPRAYRHTSNNRRVGSLRGDFIFTFSNLKNQVKTTSITDEINELITEQEIVEIIGTILEDNNSLTPEDLFTELYIRYVPILYQRVLNISSDEEQTTEMIKRVSKIEILDSEKQEKLKQHFHYENGLWSSRGVLI